MTFQKRMQKILQIIDELGEVDNRRLADELGVSEITVRRDLARMASDGHIYRTHGGAMKVDQLIKPVSFVNKAVVNVKAKDEICKRAAEEIVEGDIIFIDCGSTAFRLCQFIKNKKIKVITNSLPVVNELNDTAVSLNLIGGEIDQKRQAIHGSIAQEHIARYRASKAFLGIDGISGAGLFAGTESEASNTLAMAKQSNYTYILCDAGKVGKETYLKFADLNLINAIITDYSGPETERFELSGVRVLKSC